MTQLQYYGILLIVILSIIVLGVGWEFWAEDQLMPLFVENYAPESSYEEWEYVVSIAVFSTIALLVPAFVGGSAEIGDRPPLPRTGNRNP